VRQPAALADCALNGGWVERVIVSVPALRERAASRDFARRVTKLAICASYVPRSSDRVT
jgi:hypothetical protein